MIKIICSEMRVRWLLAWEGRGGFLYGFLFKEILICSKGGNLRIKVF